MTRVVPDRGLSGGDLAALAVTWVCATGFALFVGLKLAARRWPIR